MDDFFFLIWLQIIAGLHVDAYVCNTLQHTATHCSTRQHTATHGNTRQHTETHCITLQHAATHCNTQSDTLQHTTPYPPLPFSSIIVCDRVTPSLKTNARVPHTEKKEKNHAIKQIRDALHLPSLVIGCVRV